MLRPHLPTLYSQIHGGHTYILWEVSLCESEIILKNYVIHLCIKIHHETTTTIRKYNFIRLYSGCTK